jgi:hypothetical protein
MELVSFPASDQSICAGGLLHLIVAPSSPTDRLVRLRHCNRWTAPQTNPYSFVGEQLFGKPGLRST